MVNRRVFYRQQVRPLPVLLSLSVGCDATTFCSFVTSGFIGMTPRRVTVLSETPAGLCADKSSKLLQMEAKGEFTELTCGQTPRPTDRPPPSQT